MLVVAREPAGTVLAVQLSSKRHDGDREWVPSGAGRGTARGATPGSTWTRVLRLHDAGMRREACALDRMRFDLVRRPWERYGWS